MKTPTVTVIVPAYGVEAWLEETLNSVASQTLRSLEVIIVNDASVDKSLNIADSFAKKDPRFTVVSHQKNLGLGGSRNTGVRHATGKYLYFLDGDDLLPTKALAQLVAAAEKHNADIVLSDAYVFQDGCPSLALDLDYPVHPTFKEKLPTDSVFTWRLFSNDYTLLMPSTFTTTCWAKLFKTEIWKKLRCEVPDNLRMAEDFIPVKRYIFSAERMVASKYASLLYRKRSGSATTKRSPRAFELFRAITPAIKMFKDVGVYSELEPEIYRFFSQILGEHLFKFAPVDLWFSYYKKAATLLNQLAQAEQPKDTLYTWRTPSFLDFCIFCCNYFTTKYIEPYWEKVKCLMRKTLRPLVR